MVFAFDYDKVDNGATISILKTSSLTDLSASATQFMFDYDRVDDDGGCNSNSNRKLAS